MERGRPRPPAAAAAEAEAGPSTAPPRQGGAEGGGGAAGERVGGLVGPRERLARLLGWPGRHREASRRLGIEWPTGVLLHGPPGTGKTLLVRELAAAHGAELVCITAGSTLRGFVGESERALRESFAAGVRKMAAGAAVVVFLDEVDALCPRRGRAGPHEARVVAQLLTLLDQVHGCRAQASRAGRPAALLVVAATNRPNAIDPALRRPGRLEEEISVRLPDAAQRRAILGIHCAGMPLGPGLDLDGLAAELRGFSGADIAALCCEAAMHAAFRGRDDTTGAAGEAEGTPAPAAVGADDFWQAREAVRPSLLRQVQTETPRVAWESIGGLADEKHQIRQALLWPLRHREAMARFRLPAARGVLLYGPPGCCKTKLVCAAATELGFPMIALSGAEVFSMYLGESEQTLREVFRRAREAAPVLVFLDEIDAITSKRAGPGEGAGAGGVAERVLATLLTELDGLENAQQIVVMAATNRPDVLDTALLRPGRFDLQLFIRPPDLAAREECLGIFTRALDLAEDVDLARIADATEGYTGAELQALCREAVLLMLRNKGRASDRVADAHFQGALGVVAPATTTTAMEHFRHFRTSQS